MALTITIFYFICALFLGIMSNWCKDDLPELIVIFSIIILSIGIVLDYQHSGWYLIKCLLQ